MHTINFSVIGMSKTASALAIDLDADRIAMGTRDGEIIVTRFQQLIATRPKSLDVDKSNERSLLLAGSSTDAGRRLGGLGLIRKLQMDETKVRALLRFNLNQFFS